MAQAGRVLTGDDKQQHIADCEAYAEQLKVRFSSENMYEKFVAGVYEPDEEVEEWLSELEEMVNV